MNFTNKNKYLSIDYTNLSQSQASITAVKHFRVTLTSKLNVKELINRNVSKVFDMMCVSISHVCTTFTCAQALCTGK